MIRRTVLFLLVMVALAVRPLFAQEREVLTFNTPVSAELNDRTVSHQYQFEGLRGETVRILLDVTSGDLDPILTILNADGAVVTMRDDAKLSNMSRSIHVDSLRLPNNGMYTIIVARFGYGLGVTSGDFTLTVERIGVGSSSGSALRYGDSVIQMLTDQEPQLYYSFEGRRGDIITVRMQRMSGDLDPALQIVNNQSILIAENDDMETSLDSEITAFALPYDGTYIIIASRFGRAAGRSTGSFVLTLNSALESGLGRTARSAIPFTYGQTATGEVTQNRPEVFYEFSGQQDDLITIQMTRTGGSLDAFLQLMDGARNVIASNDDFGNSQNAQIDNFRLPTTGIYTIVATRFQAQTGDTLGGFTLTLQSSGGAFSGIPDGTSRIEYGNTVTGTITDAQPQQLFAFRGADGDNLTVQMYRADGNLDAFLEILDENLQVLTSDDDSGGNQNALIGRFTLPNTGLYYIRAGRYSDGVSTTGTSGQFVLVLAQRFD